MRSPSNMGKGIAILLGKPSYASHSNRLGYKDDWHEQDGICIKCTYHGQGKPESYTICIDELGYFYHFESWLA
jgi:hypothetical protein